jgi:hypothetical protein
MIDNTTRHLVRCAQDEIETVLRSLTSHDQQSKRPTLSQCKAMVASLANARRFTAAALASDKAEPDNV